MSQSQFTEHSPFARRQRERRCTWCTGADVYVILDDLVVKWTPDKWVLIVFLFLLKW